MPWINRLRRAVFPHGRLRKEEDESLPSTMMKILQEAQKDPDVLRSRMLLVLPRKIDSNADTLILETLLADGFV